MTPTPPKDAPAALEPVRILSSAHLAHGPHAELSELEFGLIIAHNAFSRWVTRCMAAAGEPDLGFNDILVLHHVHHRQRGKKLADICFTLNFEDTHVISYALKKLSTLGLVQGEKAGKEVLYGTTPKGAQLIESFRTVRGRCLLAGIDGDLADGEAHADVARRLRTVSGLYDQAARAASAL
ncbi:winged helix DNA-binding protein [Bordetella hinzii]|uniref:winged helix DNA-binding protein n=1 Tax=Bordetella hinzii TaxID=103855 RepID=UPI001C01892C|nr:winged helix DNA-binding protein [Bordetella hinzii]QWF47882.1 winged helix DNA-binding protein [Bordetella hinzii]